MHEKDEDFRYILPSSISASFLREPGRLMMMSNVAVFGVIAAFESGNSTLH